jgi:integrase
LELGEIEPRHIYKYVSDRDAKIAARREIAVLSHAYTKAVEWGYLNKHPFKGEVRLKGEKPRTRYVTDEEIIACLSLSSKRKRGSVHAIQAYIRLKLLTGLRRGDLLRLRVSDLREDGIHITTHKTGKPVIYEWSDDLRLAVALAKKMRPVDISPYLFCTTRGTGYLDEKTGEAYGWSAMWQRFMDRVMEETELKERFTEHDLRAKAASDAESLEHARALLSHADSRITQRVYRRKPEKVKPLK